MAEKMTNKELSAWASALVKLIENGLTDEAVEILKSVIITDDKSGKQA